MLWYLFWCHYTTLEDMTISSINYIIASWKLQQEPFYSLAIIVWVNNFQTPEI